MAAKIMNPMIIAILCALVISACKHKSDNADVADLLARDLTGTWLNSAVVEAHDVSSGDYLYTFYEARTYIFQDAGEMVEVSRCASFGEIDYFATKTANSFDFDSSGEVVFMLTENGQLIREYEDVSPSDPNTFWKLKSTLSKVSDDITVDNGALEIIGPISVVKNDNVCISQNIFGTGDNSTYYITVPFDTDSIALQLTLRAPFVTGSHEYMRSSDTGIFSSFGIWSDADKFIQTIGINNFFPDAANIEITDSNPNNIEGSFSFIGADGRNYGGTFQLIPIDQPL